VGEGEGKEKVKGYSDTSVDRYGVY